MLDLEKLEVILASFEKKGYEATVLMSARQIELTLRKQCPTRNKWYGMTRHLAWISVETCSFDLIEFTFNAMEVELVREALLDDRPMPRYEDQVFVRQPVTGAEVFRSFAPMNVGSPPALSVASLDHQGYHRPGLANK